VITISRGEELNNRRGLAIVRTLDVAEDFRDLRVNRSCKTMRAYVNHLSNDKERRRIYVSHKSSECLNSVLDLNRVMPGWHVNIRNVSGYIVFPLEVNNSDSEIVNGIVAKYKIGMVYLCFFPA